MNYQTFTPAGPDDSALVHTPAGGCHRCPVIAWQMRNSDVGWYAHPVFAFEVTAAMAVAVAVDAPGGTVVCGTVQYASERAFADAMKRA